MRDSDRFVWLGWIMRDYYNAIGRACEKLENERGAADRLRQIDGICHAADQCVKVLESMEPLFPDA
jgi:hypothetical protein